MSVVIAKSVCLYFFDFISLSSVCVTLAIIIWFGHPGHHVIVSFVCNSFEGVGVFILVFFLFRFLVRRSKMDVNHI